MFEHSARLEREYRTLRAMIDLYCRDHHQTRGEPCAECSALLGYAGARIEHCPHGDEKPSCAKCTVHCFRTEMRERVRVVMRYAGPRMLLRHPLLSVLHYLDSRRSGTLKRSKRTPRATAG